jgi:phospholipid-binding lipoprotein MlaA
MSSKRSLRLLATATLLGAGLVGCATPPPASDAEALAEYKATNDPLEPANRVLYQVNNAIDEVILRPLAVGYRHAVPEVMRERVHNVLANLNAPVVLANDMLEGKPRRAGDTLARFVINSTAGVGGLFDVATDAGYPSHEADFGLTLAYWGVGEGPFLFLPVLGPTNPRDASGYGVDIALDPFTWFGQGAVVSDLGYTRYGTTVVDTRAGLIPDLDNIKEQALDPYATFRSLYRQHRKAQLDQLRSDTRATTPAWYPAPPGSGQDQSNQPQ